MSIAAPVQEELPIWRQEPREKVEWLVSFLKGRGWVTAAAVLVEAGFMPTENNKRKVRSWADGSGGRVAGHQKGYKLVREMTEEEYSWFRNEALKSADSIRKRVLESDQVFFRRSPI